MQQQLLYRTGLVELQQHPEALSLTGCVLPALLQGIAVFLKEFASQRLVVRLTIRSAQVSVDRSLRRGQAGRLVVACEGNWGRQAGQNHDDRDTRSHAVWTSLVSGRPLSGKRLLCNSGFPQL